MCHMYLKASLFMQKLAEKKSARNVQLSVKEALRSKKDEVSRESEARSPESHIESDDDDDDDANFDARMRRQILEKRKELGDMPTKQKSSNG